MKTTPRTRPESIELNLSLDPCGAAHCGGDDACPIRPLLDASSRLRRWFQSPWSYHSTLTLQGGKTGFLVSLSIKSNQYPRSPPDQKRTMRAVSQVGSEKNELSCHEKMASPNSGLSIAKHLYLRFESLLSRQG